MKEKGKKPYIYGMLAGFGAISLSVLFFFILYRIVEFKGVMDALTAILAPIIYGAVIAYLLRPTCNWFERALQKCFPKLKPRLADALAVAFAMVAGVLIVYALIAILAPQLYESAMNIWEGLPEKADQLVTLLETQYVENKGLIEFFGQSSATIYETVDKWIENDVVPNLSSIVSGVGMSVWKVLVFLKDFLIGIIVAVYFLANRKQFLRQSKMLLQAAVKPEWAKIVFDEVAYIDYLFGGFITGKLLDSAIIGVLC